MHSFGIAIVPVDTTDIYDFISRLIAPYNSEIEVEPYKAFFSAEDANYLAWHHGARNLEELVKLLQKKGADDFGLEDGRFYRISTNNPNSKWDYWIVGGNFTERLQGRNAPPNLLKEEDDEHLLANVCEVVNLLDEIIPALVIEPTKDWHDCDDFKSEEAWAVHVRELFGKYPQHLAVVLDVHF